MPTLKDILVKQAAIPGNLEKSLPAVAPKLSQILTNVATGLPVNPDLPELPIAPGGAAPQFPGGVADIIKGVEDMLPAMVPKIGGTAPAALSRGGYRPASTALPTLPGGGRVLGSGYRSI